MNYSTLHMYHNYLQVQMKQQHLSNNSTVMVKKIFSALWGFISLTTDSHCEKKKLVLIHSPITILKLTMAQEQES